MTHENQELQSYKSSDEMTTKNDYSMLKQISRLGPTLAKHLFLDVNHCLPKALTQDMTSSQGFAVPLPVSAALALGWLGHACTPTMDISRAESCPNHHRNTLETALQTTHKANPSLCTHRKAQILMTSRISLTLPAGLAAIHCVLSSIRTACFHVQITSH